MLIKLFRIILKEIREMATDIAELDTAIAALSTQVNQIGLDVAAVSAGVTQVDSDVTALLAKLANSPVAADFTNEVATLQGSLATLKTVDGQATVSASNLKAADASTQANLNPPAPTPAPPPAGP
jgi:phage shock protein A